MNRRIFSAALMAATLSVALAFAQPATTGPAPMPGFLPDPTGSTGELLEDGVWIFRLGPALIRLTPLDDQARRDYIREQTGSRIDPFGPKPDGSPRFISFKLEIMNRSKTLIVFEPQKTVLMALPTEMKLPVDLARMQTGYSVHEQEMPAEFSIAGQALLNRESHLPPGVKSSGLLAFTALKNSPREFYIELVVLDDRGKTYEYRAAYATEKRLNKKMKKLEKQLKKGKP